jgi:hypothetical protein
MAVLKNNEVQDQIQKHTAEAQSKQSFFELLWTICASAAKTATT